MFAAIIGTNTKYGKLLVGKIDVYKNSLSPIHFLVRTLINTSKMLNEVHDCTIILLSRIGETNNLWFHVNVILQNQLFSDVQIFL